MGLVIIDHSYLRHVDEVSQSRVTVVAANFWRI